MKGLFRMLAAVALSALMCFSAVTPVLAQEGTAGVILNADKYYIYQNEQVNFDLDNVEAGAEISWYVNDVLVEGQTGTEYVFSGNAVGKYKIYAKVNGTVTSIKTVEIIEKEIDIIREMQYTGQQSVENFDGYGNTEPIPGIDGTPDFKVTNDGTNGYLESVETGWGGAPWYCLDAAALNLVENWEIAFDVIYPENVYGIACVLAGTIVDNQQYEILALHNMENGTALLYANGANGQLYNSTNPDKGGVGNSFTVTAGVPVHLQMIKNGSTFYAYVDGVLQVKTVINFNFTKISGLCPVQFLEKGTGIRFDNLSIKGYTLPGSESNVVYEDTFDSVVLENDTYASGFDGENGYIEAIKSEGGISPWYALDIGSKNLVDYTITYDILFDRDAYGISGLNLGRIVDDIAYEISCIQMNADGTSFIYANGVGGQIINSTNPELGGTGATSPLKFGVWSAVKFEKIGQHINIYIDEVKLVSIDLDFNFTKLQGVSFTQYLFDGTDGIRIDNLKIERAKTLTEAATGKTFVENFDARPDGEALAGIDGTVDFKVVNDGTNGYLQGLETGWGGTAWYGLELGSDAYNFTENYEISYDFMFPAGTHGMLITSLGTAVNNIAQEFGGFYLYADGNNQIYSYNGADLIINSWDVNAGGISTARPVKAEKWATLRIVKIGKNVEIYLNDVQMVSKYVDFNWTKLSGISFVQVMESGAGVCIDNLVVKDVDPVAYENDFSSNPLIYNVFASTTDGSNQYLESIKSEGGTSSWFAQSIAGKNVVDYTISYDIMFPAGTYGITGVLLDRIVDGTTNLEMPCVQMNADGTSFIYANNITGEQLINSEDPNLGGLGAVSPLKFGEWATVTLEKKGQHINIYIEDVQMVSIDLAFNFTNLHSMAFSQFLFDGTTGVRIDNLKIVDGSVEEKPVIPVESIEISVSALSVVKGDVLGVRLNVQPLDADVEAVEWYIDDVLVEGETSDVLNYVCNKTGNLKVHAKVGSLVSKPKVIAVSEQVPIEVIDTSDWGVLREEDFEYWSKGDAWGAPNPDVLKSDGEGHIEHQPGEPYAKCGMFWEALEFPGNYVLKFDFMYKEGTLGKIQWSIPGFFTDDSTRTANIYVEKFADDVVVGIWDANGDVLSSKRISLGATGNDLKDTVRYDEWSTFTVYKVDDVIAIYVDDVCGVLARMDTIKDATVNTCIITTNFAANINAGCYLDNVKLLVEKTEGDEIEVVTISASQNTAKIGESVFFTANTFPTDVEYSSVQWFVNGAEVTDATDIEYEFRATAGGEYSVKCVIDGIESGEKKIVVSGSVSGGGEKVAGCGSSMQSVGWLFVLLTAAGAVAAIRRKDENNR